MRIPHNSNKNLCTFTFSHSTRLDLISRSMLLFFPHWYCSGLCSVHNNCCVPLCFHFLAMWLHCTVVFFSFSFFSTLSSNISYARIFCNQTYKFVGCPVHIILQFGVAIVAGYSTEAKYCCQSRVRRIAPWILWFPPRLCDLLQIPSLLICFLPLFWWQPDPILRRCSYFLATRPIWRTFGIDCDILLTVKAFCRSGNCCLDN